MLKIAIPALLLMVPPALSSETEKSQIMFDKAKATVNVLVEPSLTETDPVIAPVVAVPPIVTEIQNSVYDIDGLIEALSTGDKKLSKSTIDYTSMQAAYLSQINYVSGKVKALSELVSSVAAGTFETRVREGSMMLGLISESIEQMVKEAQESPELFKEFIDNKLTQLSVTKATYSYEFDEGIYTIEAKYPFSDDVDIISAVKMPDGKIKMVAFVPREFETINDVINGLFQSANAADALGDELERQSITKDAIKANHFIEEVKTKVKPEVLSE